jgi:hypothetical protein
MPTILNPAEADAISLRGSALHGWAGADIFSPIQTFSGLAGRTAVKPGYKKEGCGHEDLYGQVS